MYSVKGKFTSTGNIVLSTTQLMVNYKALIDVKLIQQYAL